MNIKELVKKYDLLLLLTFGSYGTDRFNRNSDIDVGYLSKRTLSIDEEMQLLHDLVMLFNRDKIDLVNLKKALPLLIYEIACKSNVLYEENNSYIQFKMRASARYADTQILRDARRKYIEEQFTLANTGK